MNWLVVIAGGAFAYVAYRMLHKRGRSRGAFLVKPAQYDFAFLADRLGVSEDYLRAFQPRYGERMIQKRGPFRSPSNQRKLHVPDAETKLLQQKVLSRILQRLRVHEAAQGFEIGTSVAKNASMHARKAVVLKMDLVSFFEKTKRVRVKQFFQRIGWTEEAAEALAKITTHEGGLPQGAPTSPALSNRVNVGMDRLITQMTRRVGTYTRYADDITISFHFDNGRRVRGVVQDVKRIARRYGYTVHESKKLRVLRRHHSQQVTGLVVNDGPRVPRKKRRWLRAVEHRLKTGGEASLTPEQLAGWKAYLVDVDRVREETNNARRDELADALAKSHHSLRGAAYQLRIPLPALKREMKVLGLWDPKKKAPRRKRW